MLAKRESSQASLPAAKVAAPAPAAEAQESTLATTKPHCFPAFYLEIADEPPKRNRELDLEEQLEKLEVNGGPEEEAAEGTWTDEKYEVEKDRAFHKFYKYLQRAPEQCVRYQLRGQPRWPLSTAVPSPPRCSCGAARAFELQLMPPMLYLMGLKGADDLDFGTVAVFVCSRSCGGSGYMQEHVVYAPTPAD
jgi:pre-rRNA-processing protein TSR4